jgi:hypothetical protein
VPPGQGRHREPHPDERHQRSRGRDLEGGGEDQLQKRNREHAGPRPHGEGAREQAHPGAQGDAQGEGGGADHREAAGEREYAAAAAQPGEDGPGVADHGRRDGRVHEGLAPGCPAAQQPVQKKPVGQDQPQQPGRRALQRVPGQHRDGTRPAQLVLHVPEAGILVPHLARVEPPRTAGQHRDRNRAQQVAARHGRHPGVNHDRLFSPHQIPARARQPRDQPDGLRPSGAGQDRRLRFWRLLGTARGNAMSLSADLRRWAMFAVWQDEAALDHFLAGSPIAAEWRSASQETWTVRLGYAGGHGQWGGRDPFEGMTAQALAPGQRVAVLTRASIRPRRLARFYRAVPAVDQALADADGCLRAVGIGEWPLARQATFSLWRDTSAVRARTRKEGWFGEECFARFVPYASAGSWDGADPLGTA